LCQALLLLLLLLLLLDLDSTVRFDEFGEKAIAGDASTTVTSEVQLWKLCPYSVVMMPRGPSMFGEERPQYLSRQKIPRHLAIGAAVVISLSHACPRSTPS
jgi:hypothetical protein